MEVVRGLEGTLNHTRRYDGTLTLHHAIDADGGDDLMVEHASRNGRDKGDRTRNSEASLQREHDTIAIHRRH